MKWHIIKHPVLFSLCLSKLTQNCVGIWEWCWWESFDKGVALCQTWACCWLHGVRVGVDVIWHPVVLNKAAVAPLQFVFQPLTQGVTFDFQQSIHTVRTVRSVGDAQSQRSTQAPWEQALLWKLNCDGNWKVFIMDTEAHSWVYLHHILTAISIYPWITIFILPKIKYKKSKIMMLHILVLLF